MCHPSPRPSVSVWLLCCVAAGYRQGAPRRDLCSVAAGTLPGNGHKKVTTATEKDDKGGSRALGLISRSVSNRRAEVNLKLRVALIRPYLDDAVQSWSPCCRMDVKMLESVQRRITKRIRW